MRNMVSFCFILTVSALWGLTPSSAFAFKITPISVTLEATGKEARATFQVENNHESSVSLKVVLAKRVVDEYGKEKYPPAGDDFLVAPTEFILAPRERRAINARYMAGTKSEHDREKAYRLIIKEIPLIEGKYEGPAQRHFGAIYVAASERVLKMSVLSAKVLSDGALEVRLKNEGTVHQILDQYQLQVSYIKDNQTQKKIFKGQEHFGQNILAGHERIFKINAELPPGVRDLKVELEGAIESAR